MSYRHDKKRTFIKWLKKETGKGWLKYYSDCFKKQKRS